MTEIELIERKIELKHQLITFTTQEIAELETKRVELKIKELEGRKKT